MGRGRLLVFQGAANDPNECAELCAGSSSRERMLPSNTGTGPDG